MSLAERLSEYVRACFTGLWIESHEHDDALLEIARLCRQEDWQLAVWDVVQGLRIPGHADAAPVEAGGNDPLAAIRSLSALAKPGSSALLVLVNFHRFLSSVEVLQALARQISAGKQNRTFVIVLSPVVQIPVELEKLFVVVEHDLPSRDQLNEIARGIATEEGELPQDDELARVLDSAAGLTRYEAEGAFSLSLVRHRRVVPAAIWELKSQILKKSGLLSLHRGNETFADLGGLEALKAFTARALGSRRGKHVAAKPRGILLLSPPGCGKTQFSKALGNEFGRPTLVLDVGALLGSLVGQTEQNIRQALRIVDVMAPCIVSCDELEKALSGVNSNGDSGVSTRLFGTLLTWLNDHVSDVFFVGTVNDISKLPPEFVRAERFDGVFMLDLPGSKEKQLIWRMYLEKYSLDPQQPKPTDDLWTGAEVKSCCRLAALLDVPLVEAAGNVVPVAKTASESVEKLRTWASGRCLSADRSGIYTRPGNSPSKPGRKVSRDPSNN